MFVPVSSYVNVIFFGVGSVKSVTCKLNTGSSHSISIRGIVNFRFSVLNRLSSELKNIFVFGRIAGGVNI